MSRLTKHFPKWAYIVLPVCMAFFAWSLIGQVARRADEFTATQLELTRIQGIVYQIHAIEEEAVAEKHLSLERAQTEEQVDQQADTAFLNLRRNHSNSALLEQVQAAYLAYDAALDVEFPYLSRGDLDGAEKIADAQVDPAYERLEQAIQKAIAYYNRQADEKRTQTALASITVLVSGGLCLGVFMQRVARSQQTAAQQEAQRAEEERTRAVLETALDAVVSMDAQGLIIGWNAQAETIFGWTKAEALGRSLTETTIPLALRENYQRNIRRFIAGQEGRLVGQRFETEALHRKGHTFPIAMSLCCVRAGERLTFSAFICDISERKQAEARLEHQALHDALTGLPNRLLFQDRLGGAIRRMARLQTGVAVLFVDLDNFKFVNDSMGHEAGDTLLKTVAQRLQDSARSGDTIARLGGDEFTLLLESVCHVEEAAQTAERIVAQLQQPIALGGREVFVSASIGIAFSSDEGLEAEDLLRDADTAMYQAKSQGKSGFVVFNSTMNADVVERMEIETGLRFAVERSELKVHYQPLIDLETGRMNGVEALVRWEHPTRGLMAPGKFIPIAEETGLIFPIGYWVLEEACRQMQVWKEVYPEYGRLTVNVNLSGKQLQRPDVVERVQAILAKTRVAPENVKLEITESVMMADVEDTVAKLHALKALGVKLAMDDFGTGYSSMASLNLFPLDTVKIDRAFVKRLTEHRESGSIVAAIIMLSKALHLDVTGEGVETAEQVSQLQELGCHIGQGYFFARPLPAAELGNGIAAGAHHFAQTICPPGKDAPDLEISDLEISDKDLVEQYLRAA